MLDCWDQVGKLKAIVKEIMDELGQPPLIGVTDGSAAAPGEVGEFITNQVVFPYAAYPANTEGNVGGLVVPPGDWDLWGWMAASTTIGFMEFVVQPTPAGMYWTIWGASGTVAPIGGSYEYALVVSNHTQGNFSVPTLLPLFVDVNQSFQTGLPAGTAYVFTAGRRRR